jgi:AI-2 transport protein TqsA
MLSVVLMYCVVNFVIQSVIQPKIVGNAVGLSATVSFLSLIFWAWVLGALGALLAIPLTLLAKGLLIDIDPSTRWLNTLISSGGTPSESPSPDEAPATAGTGRWRRHRSPRSTP